MVTDVDVATRIMTYALYGEEGTPQGDGAGAAAAAMPPARPLTPARKHGPWAGDSESGGGAGLGAGGHVGDDAGGDDGGGTRSRGSGGGLGSRPTARRDDGKGDDDDEGGSLAAPRGGVRGAGAGDSSAFAAAAAMDGLTDEAVVAAFSAGGPAAGTTVDVEGKEHLAVRRALTTLAKSRGGEVPLGAELAAAIAREAAPARLLSDGDGLLRWLAAQLHALVNDGKVVVAGGTVVLV